MGIIEVAQFTLIFLLLLVGGLMLVKFLSNLFSRSKRELEPDHEKEVGIDQEIIEAELDKMEVNEETDVLLIEEKESWDKKKAHEFFEAVRRVLDNSGFEDVPLLSARLIDKIRVKKVEEE